MKRFTVYSLVLFSFAALMVLTSARAFAIDGVVLINQNTSVSGLPGCGSSVPIVICNPGSYRLPSNLTITGNTDAIVINADNVTLDLNGFIILGPGTCTGFPVSSCTGQGIGIVSIGSDVSVLNGSVVGFSFGISLEGLGGLVERVHATFNGSSIFGDGIFVSSGIVRLSTATSNFFGIVVNDEGIAESNTARGNATGIVVNRGSAIGNVLLGNTKGLSLLQTTYGSNSLQNNGTNVFNGGGATSQNNNNCDGSVC